MRESPPMADELTITRPDDWHLHVRDGAALATVVPASARQFGRAIIMPNLKPPVTTTQAALAYRDRIVAAVPPDASFEPLMTLYLTDTLARRRDPARARGRHRRRQALPGRRDDEQRCRGHRRCDKTYAALEAMQKLGMPLLVHGEVTDPAVDLFDRERVFLETQLIPLRNDFPELKIVMEHITTREAAQYVAEAGARTAATITAHHLLYNRNAIFLGGIRPHYYCLPVLKRETHRLRAGRGGDVRTRALLPRHRQRAACGRAEGARDRLRRLLHRADRARAVCRGLRRGRRARPARGIRQLQWPGVLRVAAQYRPA